MISVSVAVDLYDVSLFQWWKHWVFIYNIIYVFQINKHLNKPVCFILILNMSELWNLSKCQVYQNIFFLNIKSQAK